jgi:alanine-glyoxylate transaminase/serine-glyoxylate transaminase/serine-pyruvate transaminase
MKSTWTVGVDVAYSGTQKCLGVPPGLAPLTVADRARERLVEQPSSWYFDLNLLSRYVESDGGRVYHHTAPVAMVYALHAGLGALLDEGLEASWARHEWCGRQLQDGLVSMGLRVGGPGRPPPGPVDDGVGSRRASAGLTRPTCGGVC